MNRMFQHPLHRGRIPLATTLGFDLLFGPNLFNELLDPFTVQWAATDAFIREDVDELQVLRLGVGPDTGALYAQR